MEIIPLIFTILEILIGLTLLTLGLSYIINKAKLKKGEEKPSGETNYIKPLSEQDTAPLLENNFKRIINGNEKSSTTSKNDTDGRKPSRAKGTEKPEERIEDSKILNKRVTVMKNLLKTRTIDEPAKEVEIRTEKRDKSLGDKILDKYVEEDNKDLFTLDVKEKKKKIK